ncbi:hypothetical protein B4119_3356 [Parageobacillus caldoxylosilyticus]|uniref:Uncharacterized protein n=1 Tax=Saccharococcus caldoxylosilyticus TaxID=81408 RepID=A0A150KWI5_9BACL|nr:hypothetical protein B4119_3356 [Parageobacillus caldoxylosilyticus]
MCHPINHLLAVDMEIDLLFFCSNNEKLYIKNVIVCRFY